MKATTMSKRYETFKEKKANISSKEIRTVLGEDKQSLPRSLNLRRIDTARSGHLQAPHHGSSCRGGAVCSLQEQRQKLHGTGKAGCRG